MNDLQKVQFKIFTKFIEFCQENNLRYYLMAGTALGAIRHQGFIPWDDDIDIAMPRKDYEKFLKIWVDAEDAYAQFFPKERNYPLFFAKIRNSNTTFIENELSNLKINHGVFIDIFPIDGYPKNKIRRLLLKVAIEVVNAKIFSYYAPKYLESFKRSNIKTKLIKKTSFIIANIVYRDWGKAYNRKLKIAKKFDFDKSDYVFNYSGISGNVDIMERKIFGDAIKCNFEGLLVNCPENCNTYLKLLYGDYLVLPPLEKRVGHHHTKVEDLDNSYLKYDSEYSIKENRE